jgi:hypothetical protein
MQRLLDEAVLDADTVGDDVRKYVVDELGDYGSRTRMWRCSWRIPPDPGTH